MRQDADKAMKMLQRRYKGGHDKKIHNWPQMLYAGQ